MNELVERLMAHRSEFLGFLRKQGANQALAEDVLQTALVRGLEPWAQLPPEDKLVPWFYRVLKNALIDQHRRAEAGQRAAERLAAEPSGDEAVAKRICGCAAGVLAALKPEYRDLLRAVDVDGVSIEEAARAAGVTANNAHVRLHRARKAMRERLENLCGHCASKDGGRCTDCYCQAEL